MIRESWTLDRGFITQALVLGIGTLMGASGCRIQAGPPFAPDAAVVTDDSAPQRSSEAGAHIPPSETPPPPASRLEARSEAEARLTHASGVSVCSQERPELADVLLTVDVLSYTAPEQRVLLRAWLGRTLAPSWLVADAEPSAQTPSGCDDHLFCWVLPQDDAERAVDRLADFLSTPQLQTFSAARAAATEQVDELYQRSPTFRLHALAEGLFTGRVDSASAKQPKALDAVLGASALGNTVAPVVHQTLLAQLQAVHISIFAPHAAQSLGHRLLDRLHPRSAAPRQSTSSYVPAGPIRIADDRYPEAQLLVIWPSRARVDARVARGVLTQLTNKIKAHHHRVLVIPHAGDGVTPRPALRVVGSWNELNELAPELDAWATQLGSVRVSASAPSSPAAPCAPQTLPGSAPSPTAAAWGRPQVLVWGAEHTQPAEEQL